MIREVTDKTAELSFFSVNEACVERLLGVGVVVMKDVVSVDALEGIAHAYRAARRHALPRRIAARAIAASGNGETKLYRTFAAKPVSTRNPDMPRHMRSITPAIQQLDSLADRFFEHQAIANRYPKSRALNQIALPINRGHEAFPRHQDSNAMSGLGFAVQPTLTRWHIHTVNDNIPGLPAYTFTTEPRDVVVLAERSGPAPSQMHADRGYFDIAEDGSVVHSGVNLENRPRYGLGAFHLDYVDIIT